MAEAIAEEYRSSLVDLNYNSKPHINMLTIIAEENVKHAPTIVDTIITHIKSVPPDLKLPSLYLVDSIMKNVGGQYITLFSKHMITIFSSVFEKVEETTRSALYKLRQTWNDILPKNILYGIDVKVHSIDPAWPITAVVVAAPPVVKPMGNAGAAVVSPVNKNPIHVNPKFLGGPGTGSQSPDAAKSQEKPAAAIKIEPTFKDKDTEMFEMKRKQDEMLKLIEEKKNQLKALEQKKLEMAAKQKKPTVLSAPAPVAAIPQVNAHKKFVNHRDPRLKKSMTLSHSGGLEKPGAISLQSVVVVPNTKLPSAALNGSISSASVTKTEENPNASTVHAFHQQSTTHKMADKSSKGSPKGKNNPNREPLGKNFKNGKKHSTSPENKLGGNAKRHCKQPFGKPKRAHFQESDSQHAKNDHHPTKKHKNEPLKSSNKSKAETHHSEERVLETNEINNILFGMEDKDYRHQQSKLTKNLHTTNTRASREVFKSKDLNSTGMPISLQEGNPQSQKSILPESIVELKPVVQQTFVETYRPDIDQKVKQENRVIESTAIKTEIQDRSYTSVPVVPKTRIHPPATSSIMLDGKNRIIYFVNDRAMTIMDNNEPREVTFAGPPRNVYIEGQPHPLLLGFDGHHTEFLTEGKINRVRFGAPSREIYVNNFPYEAQFGGPHFTALLEDQKEHKIRIDGPPPQVMISESPAYDLYEHYMVKNIKKEPEDLPLVQDVDMRLKPSQMMLPECKKDMDWRHVAALSDSGPQMPWEMPQNSFETYRDLPGARNYAPGVTSIATPMEYLNNSIPMNVKSEHFYPDRNSSINQPPWPHPGYRDGEMNLLNQTIHMQQKPQHIPPNMPWDMKTATTLAPPPGIPLSLSTQSSNFNLGGPKMDPPPPPFWDPLPPPPMFPGPGLESQVRGPSLPNPIPEPVVKQPSILPSPVNVNTIYEKLIAAGILPKKAEEPKISEAEPANKDSKTSEEVKEEEEIKVPHIRLTPKSLREYNPAGIALLYRGSQCATCGMRFKEIQSEQYSRHLDWHFRMNRREKDGAKKAYSRRMYYEIKDWIQFKEIEEAEERMPSYFELQTDSEASKNEEQEKVQSVPASECESEKCSVCGDKFQLFWVEEEEEWHLKNAVIHEGEAYHPMCYEDHKKAVESAKKAAEEPEVIVPDPIKEEPQEPMSVDQDLLIKEEEIKKEPEDSPEPEQAASETPEGKKETESSGDKPTEENAINIKEEDNKPTGEVTEMEVDKSESATESEEVAKEEDPVKVSVPEVKPAVESVGSPVEEFRPPTPDPRFEVLQPVFKGTELSALCTIM